MAHQLDQTVPSEEPLGIHDVAFRSAVDVADFAQRAPLLTGTPRCESWHLGRDGRFVCGTSGTPRDSLRDWALDPERLVHTFLRFRRRGTCTPDWVIVDERRRRGHGDDPGPTEVDAEQFMQLRHRLEVVGIRLMDAVIFDAGRRWWSMCELLTGTTEWNARPFPSVELGRPRGVA